MFLIQGQRFMRVSGYSSRHDVDVEILSFACENPTMVGTGTLRTSSGNYQWQGVPGLPAQGNLSRRKSF